MCSQASPLLPGFSCDSGTAQGAPDLESRSRQRPLSPGPRSGGTVGDLCSQTARPYKSCIAASPAKNSPSHRACLCPSSQDVVFPGGASWLLVLCVLNTVSLTARGPGAMEEAAPVAVPTWTSGGLLQSPHLWEPPTFIWSLPLPSLALLTHTLPLQRTLRSLILQGPGVSQNVD